MLFRCIYLCLPHCPIPELASEISRTLEQEQFIQQQAILNTLALLQKAPKEANISLLLDHLDPGVLINAMVKNGRYHSAILLQEQQIAKIPGNRPMELQEKLQALYQSYVCLNQDYTNLSMESILEQYKIGGTREEQRSIESDYLREYPEKGWDFSAKEVTRMELYVHKVTSSS